MSDSSRLPAPGSQTKTGINASAVCAAIIAAALLAMALSGVAWANEEESREANVLVEQAIALLANDAGTAQVAERIDDALAAPNQRGVDVVQVRRARDLVERTGQAGASRQAQLLLLDSLAGRLPSAPKGGQLATGDDTGTRTILNEFRPARGISDGADAALLGLALTAILAGLWLSHRLRPPHTIRQLEHRRAPGRDSEH